ncbi:4547_t:CDS:2 [Diversispora eburnea]|uniref:4547_t:CDS:1 n=1 Tax=Diversispora eburnea TaxID=1213867 RepID=A0A9N8Z233_9GLOM|nr:4547_t:CDS:2 [Diversispora eburnea]
MPAVSGFGGRGILSFELGENEYSWTIVTVLILLGVTQVEFLIAIGAELCTLLDEYSNHALIPYDDVAVTSIAVLEPILLNNNIDIQQRIIQAYVDVLQAAYTAVIPVFPCLFFIVENKFSQTAALFFLFSLLK